MMQDKNWTKRSYDRYFQVLFPSLSQTFYYDIKVGLSPSKKKQLLLLASIKAFKMMKYAFYFILKALFVLKIFKLLS